MAGRPLDTPGTLEKLYGPAEDDDVKATKLGRPPRPFDLQHLVALAAGLATMTDMAAELKCSVRTLERRFLPEITAARGMTLNRIRGKQVAMALGGNERLLMHVGRAEGRQKYTDISEHTGAGGGAIVFEGIRIMSAAAADVDDGETT